MVPWGWQPSPVALKKNIHTPAALCALSGARSSFGRLRLRPKAIAVQQKQEAAVLSNPLVRLECSMPKKAWNSKKEQIYKILWRCLKTLKVPAAIMDLQISTGFYVISTRIGQSGMTREVYNSSSTVGALLASQQKSYHVQVAWWHERSLFGKKTPVKHGFPTCLDGKNNDKWELFIAKSP
jgi:hypothetical protein